MAILKPIFSLMVSMFLVFGSIPALAFADPSENSPSNTEREVSEEPLKEEEADSLEEAQKEESNAAEEEDTKDTLGSLSEQQAESFTNKDSSTSLLSEENSWRYSSGTIITSKEGASPDLSNTNYGIAPYAAVTNPGGYVVFNWFDQFSRGYYTGTGAFKGIDVSYHNGVIDWAKVKASGVDYAIIRCGYGMDLEYQDDKQWFNNVEGCLNNGIPFGVYLYSHASDTSRASSEADHVLRLLNEAGLSPSDLGYPVYFDMEDQDIIDGGNYAAVATTFCNKIEAAGYEAGIYSSTSWFNNRLTDSCFNNWTKWVAQWNASSGLTYDGLSNFTSGNGMWQFSDYGSIPGISGPCDLNYTFMDPSNLTLDIDGVFVNEKCQIVSAENKDLALTVQDSPTSGSQVYLSEIGESVQDWDIAATGGGLAAIRLSCDRFLVLDAAKNPPANGAAVSTYTKNGGLNQKWLIEPTGLDNEYLLRNAADKDLVLSATDSGNAIVQTYSGKSSQKWSLRYNLSDSITSASGMQRNATGGELEPSVSVSLLGKTLEKDKDYKVLYNESDKKPVKAGSYKVSIEGIGNFVGSKEIGTMLLYEKANINSNVSYQFASAANTSLVLDAAKAVPVSGANVSVYNVNGGANQAWHVEFGDDGYYTIKNAANTSLVLDAAKAVPVSGANVSVYNANGGLNQKWIIEQRDNSYVIKNAANPSLVLDAAKMPPYSGSNVSVYSDNGGNNQRWQLIGMNA